MIKIDEFNLHSILPFLMQNDRDIKIIAQIVQEEFDLIAERERNLFIYGNFQALDESILDELAYQWKTEGYEQTFPHNVKAKLVKTSYVVRKTKGTSYAVEKTVQDIHGDFELLEWWETDIEPYHFKIIGPSSPPGDKLSEIYKAIEITKNERSFLAGIIVSSHWEGNNFHGKVNHLSLFEDIPLSQGAIDRIESYIGGING